MAVITQYTLVNPGAETGTTTGWTSVSGTTGFAVKSTDPLPSSGSYYFIAGNSAIANTYQDIQIISDAANTAIDANAAVATISWLQGGYSTGGDNGSLQLRFMNGASFLGNTSTPSVLSPYTWESRATGTVIPYGTRKIRVELVGYRTSGSNNDVYFDSIGDVIILDKIPGDLNVTSIYAETISDTFIEKGSINVSSVYAETISDSFIEKGSINVTSVYAETISDSFIEKGIINVSSVYIETLSDVNSNSANVYQMYAEVIVGAILPRVLVAGGT